MSKKISVLSHYGSFSGLALQALFTVDNTEPYVPAEYTDGGAHDIVDYRLLSSDNYSTFARADNIILISAGISIPAPFSLYENQFILNVHYPDDEGTGIPFPGLGINSLTIPFENYEFPIDLFFKPSAQAITNPVWFGAQVTGRDGASLKISMLNIPDALNGVVFGVSVFAKIAHNLPLAT